MRTTVLYLPPSLFYSYAVLPTITVPPQSIAVAMGMEGRFTCFAIGFPAPEIEWVFQGSVVGRGTELLISEATESTMGLYTCSAVNLGGVTNQTAHLFTFGKHTYYTGTVGCKWVGY